MRMVKRVERRDGHAQGLYNGGMGGTRLGFNKGCSCSGCSGYSSRVLYGASTKTPRRRGVSCYRDSPINTLFREDRVA
jgi:hypothetical protein